MNEAWRIAFFECLAFFLSAGAAAIFLLRLQKRSRTMQAIVFAMIVAISLIPVDGLNGSQYFLTIAGHLSFTSMCLLTAFVVRALWSKAVWKRAEKRMLLSIALLGSVFLYAAAFGVMNWDIYQLGYGSVTLIGILAAVAFAAAAARFNILFTAFVTAAIGFQLHLLRSNNIWDYLIDPLLAIYAAVGLIVWAVGLIISRRQSISEIR
jgi:hypothetical protein